MPVTQSTDTLVRVEPTIAAPALEWGPSDYLPSNGVLLTAEYLRRVGAQPAQVGTAFAVNLWYYLTVSGVPTAHAIDTWTVEGSFWDPVSRVATDFATCAAGPGTGQLILEIAADAGVPAGMYRFEVEATFTQVFTMLSGWIEVLPERPVGA